VLVLGRNREIQLANRSALSFLRLDAPIIGKTLDEVVPDFHISGFDRSSHDQTETRVTLRDGTNRLFGFTATRVEADGRTVIVFRDITETVEVRERKRRADELALVGEMVSRLSHEIKNPLASLLMGVKTLQRSTPQSSRQGQMLQIILEEVNSLTKIVDQLLEAAHPRTLFPTPIYVEPLLERSMDAYGFQAIRRGVRLEIVRSPFSTVVLVDEQSMLRVLDSLIQNALDACSKGDLIRVGWRELDQVEKEELVPGFSGRIVSLFVEDKGSGIVGELSVNESKVFRAFVSTKVSGTGLGLTVSRDIVEDHGGIILVDSLANRGTRVQILLPIAEGLSCWDWHRDRSVVDSAPGRIDCASCDVRSRGTGHFCWKIKEHAHYAVTGQWPEHCLKCGFFRTSRLTPFFKSRLVQSKVQ
jgi:signal transduction histidine kinase